MADYTAKRMGDMEASFGGGFIKARAELGVTAFGFQVIQLPPGFEGPMTFTAWVGLAQPRELDALSLAFFSDALLPAVFMRLTEPSVVPTVDLTVHFRAALPRSAERDPEELCLARMQSRVIHEGFFEEDGVIWAPDGQVLAQSRQLGLVLPRRNS